MSVYRFDPDERIDPNTMTVNRAETAAHLNRYLFARSVITRTRTAEPVRILDIACGLGYGTQILSQLPASQLIGIDISPSAVTYAQKHYSSPNIRFQTGDLTRLPKTEAGFDFIVSFETIEHVTLAEALRALKNFFTLLKPNGCLIISTPNRYFTFLLSLIGWRCQYHPYEFKPSEFKTYLKTAGFSPLISYGQTCIFPLTYFPARFGWLPQSYFYPVRLLPQMAAQNFIFLAYKSK